MKKVQNNYLKKIKDTKVKSSEEIIKSRLHKIFKRRKWHFIGEMRAHYLLKIRKIISRTLKIFMNLALIISKYNCKNDNIFIEANRLQIWYHQKKKLIKQTKKY